MTVLKIGKNLKTRLQLAKANGNLIADAILDEIRKKDPLVEESNSNYFDMEVAAMHSNGTLDVSGSISACKKSMSHERIRKELARDPDKPWKPAWRTDIGVSRFVTSFKKFAEDPFSGADYSDFMSALLLESKIKIRIASGKEIYRAYYEGNYSRCHSVNTLHTSCMRYDRTALAAQSFYNNLCGNRIMVAENAAGQIVGRAIVWDDVTLVAIKRASDFSYLCPETVEGINAHIQNSKTKIFRHLSFIDRIYVTNDYILRMMRDYARDHNIDLFKSTNTCHSVFYFGVLNEGLRTELGDHCNEGHIVNGLLFKRLKSGKEYLGGCPYLDTLKYVVDFPDDDNLWLSTSNGTNVLCYGDLTTSSGRGPLLDTICVNCGQVALCGSLLCGDCASRYMQSTPFGPQFIGSWVTKYGVKLPKPFANSKYLARDFVIQKINKDLD